VVLSILNEEGGEGRYHLILRRFWQLAEPESFWGNPKKANSFRYVCVRFDSSRFTQENAFSQKFLRAPVAKGFLSCIFA